jgi:hypothetical protein
MATNQRSDDLNCMKFEENNAKTQRKGSLTIFKFFSQ